MNDFNEIGRISWILVILWSLQNFRIFGYFYLARENIWLQKWLKYKVKSLQIRSTPPTAQTPGPNLFIFWREPPHVNAFRGTEAIFEFHSWSRDISQKLSIFESQLDPSKTPKCAHISDSRKKFKNRLGAPESIHMRGLVPKNEPIRPRRLGCRGGGATDFDDFHLIFRSFLYEGTEEGQER